MSRPILGCTGTRGDYARHIQRGEKPCPESRESNRVYCAHYREANPGLQVSYRRAYYARTGK
jgi:hypothetical protein